MDRSRGVSFLSRTPGTKSPIFLTWCLSCRARVPSVESFTTYVLSPTRRLFRGPSVPVTEVGRVDFSRRVHEARSGSRTGEVGL